MLLAIGILQELTEKRHPEDADVEKLRKIVDPAKATLPIDELCCEIIQDGIRRSRAARPRA